MKSTSDTTLPCDETTSPAVHTFCTHLEDAGTRLDKFLAKHLHAVGISREKVKHLIQNGYVACNGVPALSSKMGLHPHTEIAVTLHVPPALVQAETGTLTIIYQDSVMATLNKPAGLTVHPAPSCPTGTLAHRLVAHFPELAKQEGFRPGIVHRLDKDTSGLLLVALTEKCRLALAAIFEEHRIFKEYLALVVGVPEKQTGIVEAPMGRHPTYKTKMAVIPQGKPAKSSWRLLYADPSGTFSLLAVRIFSGRTHQVRVHMQHSGHPLWGDRLYGKRVVIKDTPAPLPSASLMWKIPVAPPARQMLHAWQLGLHHPLPEALLQEPPIASAANQQDVLDADNVLRFHCPPPDDFTEAVRYLSRRTLRIVLTGSPGCGKTSVLHLLEKHGIPAFSADAVVQAMYTSDGHGTHFLRGRYGDRFITEETGGVNKRALATAMKEDDSIRREVEAFLHPLVRSALDDFWNAQDRLETPFAVAEIPLYLEAGFSPAQRESAPVKADIIHEALVLVGVQCPFATRRERLLTKRGWSAETIAHVESWQWPEDKKMRACSIVVPNTGTPEDLAEKTHDLLNQLSMLQEQREQQIIEYVQSLWNSKENIPSDYL